MLEEFKRFFENQKREKQQIADYFEKCTQEIDDNNLYLLHRMCKDSAIVFLGMLFLAFLFVPGFKITIGHCILIVLVISYFFVNVSLKKKQVVTTFTVSFTCLFFYFWLCISFILMDIYSTVNQSVLWLLILMMAFPVVFIDRQYKYVIEETVAFLAFVLFKLLLEREDFYSDVYAVFAAYVMSLIISNIILIVRSRQGLDMDEIKRYSSMDKLTHLYNKAALIQEINKFLGKRTEDTSCAMCIIDVDNFKHINDSLGHSGGDRVLEYLGSILLSSFRPCDIVGRFGGDEFVVFMPNMRDKNIVELRCKSLQMLMAEFDIGNEEPFTLSVGSIVDMGNHSREDLFRMADDALYKSKLMGKNRCTSWITSEDKLIEKPLLVMVNTLNIKEGERLKKEEKDRFEIFSTDSEDDAIEYISQYHDMVRLIVVEVGGVGKSGEFVFRYLKERERFSVIPVIAVVVSDEGRALAWELRADAILSPVDPVAVFKKKATELSGL